MPHYRDTINADGSFNIAAIMQIAIGNARKWKDVPWSFAMRQELQPVWQVARALKADFDRRATLRRAA